MNSSVSPKRLPFTCSLLRFSAGAAVCAALAMVGGASAASSCELELQQSATAAGVDSSADWDSSAVTDGVALAVVPIPEPSVLVATIGGVGMLLGMQRWKGSR